METWKPVKGYEVLYEVSSDGRIRGLKSNKILKPGNTGRYLFVVLMKNGQRKDILVHRIVAEAFCKKEEHETEVNHINEIKFDNRAENLEWCTRLENIRHGTGIARRAALQKNRHGSKAILQISKNGEIVARFPSVREVTRKTSYDKAFVARCAHGRCETAYGFKWAFADTKDKVTTA